jgi:hypothetical protein
LYALHVAIPTARPQLALAALASRLHVSKVLNHAMSAPVPQEALRRSSGPFDLVGSALDGCSLPAVATPW